TFGFCGCVTPPSGGGRRCVSGAILDYRRANPVQCTIGINEAELAISVLRVRRFRKASLDSRSHPLRTDRVSIRDVDVDHRSGLFRIVMVPLADMNGHTAAVRIPVARP